CAESLTPDLSVYTPTGHSILGGAADNLEEVEESGNATVVEEADESVLSAVAKTVKGLIELMSKEVVERLVRRPYRKPRFKKRATDFVDTDKLSTIVSAQWAEEHAWSADEYRHWSSFCFSSWWLEHADAAHGWVTRSGIDKGDVFGFAVRADNQRTILLILD